MKVTETAQTSAPASFMARFRQNKAGNTMAMFAIALVPMVAMSGSAVDVGRGYLVKTRLQQACDAGVLAGRKSMGGGTYDGPDEAVATSYFNTNMRSGVTGSTSNWLSGATSVTFSSRANSSNEVVGTASAEVPVTLMKMFGYTKLDLNVGCNARLDVSNTDVVMVLDVTGSMNQCANDDNPGTNGCTTSNNKISGLRSAVRSFYNTIRAATDTNTRFRIGFVPYSSSVNMGAASGSLLPSSWVVSNWTYQSRVANMNTPGYHPTTTYGSWTQEQFSAQISNANCNNYSNNVSFTQLGAGSYTAQANWNTAVPTNDVFTPSGAPSSQSTTQSQRVSTTWSSGNKSCIRQYRTATTTYAANGRFAFTNWTYKPVQYDVSQYVAGAPITVYRANAAPLGSVVGSGEYNMVELVNDPGSTVIGDSTTFDGCFEERDTVAQASFSNIPSNAYDLLHNTVPSNSATQWRPIWGDLVYNRGSVPPITTTTSISPTYATCPTAVASKLADRSLTDINTFVGQLSPGGSTYHDLGMAWGLRMASATGIWGSENTTAPNGNPISRHIIFMTDGVICPSRDTYGSHGLERIDNRVAPFGTTDIGSSSDCNNPGSGDTLANRHNSRFLAMCNAARADGISVWTVAFGTSNPPTLVSCADPGQSFTATNSTALQAQFQAIASRIAQLRLSQ